MTEDIMANVNLNKILIAILEQVKEIKIPTDKLLDASNTDKELVLTYDDQDTPMFIITIRDKDGTSN